jgi:hypothetical protein
MAHSAIHTQRILITGRRDPLGRANGGGVEQKLREEGGSINGRPGAIRTLKQFERRDFRGWRVRWQVEYRHTLIMPERIGHVPPVENVLRSAQRLGLVLGKFLMSAPGHCGGTPRTLKVEITFALRQSLRWEPATETGKSGGRKESTGRVKESSGEPSRRRFGRLHL